MIFVYLVIIPFAIGIYAQWRIKSAYKKNVNRLSRGKITGREAAQAVMQSAGIYDVEIIECRGELTDYYDPRQKRLALSSDNYRGYSLAALGVAAHEAGHAIQHKEKYGPLETRMALIPITNISSRLLNFVMFGGFVFGFIPALIQLAIIGYLVVTFFQLVTLPVEFDASIRAKKHLLALGIVERDEIGGVEETLNAAAFTYVAAFISSLFWLLYMLLQRR